MNTIKRDITNASQWQTSLEKVFNLILKTRMQGIPVVNPALRVDARYLTRWNQYFLGVLITPWFMNLLLLPADTATAQTFSQLAVGSKQTHPFPSGPYEFIVGEEEGLGRYQSCSLFSPMFDFADQQAALDTAAAVLQELMKQENHEKIDMREKEIAAIWQQDKLSDENNELDTSQSETETETEVNAPKEQTTLKMETATKGHDNAIPSENRHSDNDEEQLTESPGLNRRQLLTGLFK